MSGALRVLRGGCDLITQRGKADGAEDSRFGEMRAALRPSHGTSTAPGALIMFDS